RRAGGAEAELLRTVRPEIALQKASIAESGLRFRAGGERSGGVADIGKCCVRITDISERSVRITDIGERGVRVTDIGKRRVRVGDVADGIWITERGRAAEIDAAAQEWVEPL